MEFKTSVVHDEEESLWLYSQLVEALNIRISDLFGNELLAELSPELIESYQLKDKIQPFDYMEIIDTSHELKGSTIRLFIEPLAIKGYKTIAKEYERLVYATTRDKLDWLIQNRQEFQIILIITSKENIKKD